MRLPFPWHALCQMPDRARMRLVRRWKIRGQNKRRYTSPACDRSARNPDRVCNVLQDDAVACTDPANTHDRLMFEVQQPQISRPYRVAIIGLMLMSATALAITIWVMNDFLREQVIVRNLIRQLPPQAVGAAEELAGELRWQFRLSILVVLNLIATGFAVMLLWRAYSSSQRSLYEIKVLATDILNSMDQGVITTDPEGKVTSVNRRGLELLSTTSASIGGMLSDISDGVDLDSFRRQARMAESSLAASNYRDYTVSHSGGNRTLRASFQPLRDRSGREIGMVLQMHDVTAGVQMEQQVRRMERYMGLGALAVGLHHEIKNPLSALSLHVQLLEEQLEGDEVEEETRELLGVLKTEVIRIAGVLEDFRDYASIDRLDRTSVDVEKLLSGLIKLLTPQATAAGIAIDLGVPSPLPLIEADRARLEQMLLNLLINAIEAMPHGGRLSLSASAGDRLTIRIADTGGGIPENLRQRIFDPYFTTKSGGTGMGLALCEKVVRQHDGQLELESTRQGAVFTVSLPLPGK